MANGVSILPGFAPGLTTEQLDTVRGETYRRVCDDLQRTVRERNVLADRVHSLAGQTARAEEERAALARRLTRLAEMTTEDFEMLRDAGVLKGWVKP